MPRHPSSLKIDAFLYFSPKWPSVGTLHLLAYTISCSIQYKSKVIIYHLKRGNSSKQYHSMVFMVVYFPITMMNMCP